MIEFLEYKQKLLEARGARTILVPIDQRKEFSIDWRGFARQISERDESICPYCFLFNKIGSNKGDNDCEGCPMSAAGNCCTEEDSTYGAVADELTPDGEDEARLGLGIDDALYEFAITKAKEQEYKKRNQNAK